MGELVHLTFDDILAIHQLQLELFGGQDGFIDENVARSAVAQPELISQFVGEDVAYLAASYLFHIASTQGFLDGNKRTGAQAAVDFLQINGYDIRANSDDLTELTMAVANHKVSKDAVVQWFRDRLISADENEASSPDSAM
jgi:death-on-curing protein